MNKKTSRIAAFILMLTGILLVAYFGFVLWTFYLANNPWMYLFIDKITLFGLGFLVLGVILIVISILLTRKAD